MTTAERGGTDTGPATGSGSGASGDAAKISAPRIDTLTARVASKSVLQTTTARRPLSRSTCTLYASLGSPSTVTAAPRAPRKSPSQRKAR